MLITLIAKRACYFGAEGVFFPPAQGISGFRGAKSAPDLSASPGWRENPGVACANFPASTVYYPGNGLTHPSYTRVIR